MSITDNEKANRPDNEDAIRGIKPKKEQPTDYKFSAITIFRFRSYLQDVKAELIAGNTAVVIESIDELVPMCTETLKNLSNPGSKKHDD